MGKARIISVNPGIKTIGELGLKSSRLARISRTIANSGIYKKSLFRKTINLLFGIDNRIDTRLSSKLMLLRVLCGVLMVSSVLVPMSPSAIVSLDFGPMPAMMCLLGISLTLGFLSRLTSYAGAGWFGYNLAMSIIHATPDASAGALMLLMLVFSILGPGMFSTDQLIRRGLFSLRRRILENRHRKGRRPELDYRAFSQLEHRISG